MKGRTIRFFVLPETDAWLEHRAGGRSNKADFVRSLIEREMARLEVFHKAAADLTESDRAEREALVGAFAAHEEKAGPKAKAKRKVARRIAPKPL